MESAFCYFDTFFKYLGFFLKVAEHRTTAGPGKYYIEPVVEEVVSDYFFKY